MLPQAIDLTPTRHADARHRASIATFSTPVSTFCDDSKSQIQFWAPFISTTERQPYIVRHSMPFSTIMNSNRNYSAGQPPIELIDRVQYHTW